MFKSVQGGMLLSRPDDLRIMRQRRRYLILEWMRIGECCKDQSRVTQAFLCLKFWQVLRFVMVFYFQLQRECNVEPKKAKKRIGFSPKSLFFMVAIGGLEPPTPGL